MSSIFKSIASAFRDLVRFKIAWIIIWPVLAATLFWSVIGYLFGDSFTELIYLAFGEMGVGEWLKNVEPAWIATSIQSLIHIIVFIPLVIMTQQLFRYDALSEHANKREIKEICASNRYSLWGLGLLTGMLQFVPVLNLLAPIFTALAFIHFGLDQLKLLRISNEKKNDAVVVLEE